MSYPAPPGLSKLHESLPARPPPSTASPAPSFKPPNNGTSAAKPAFTAFAPRQVTSSNTYRTSSPAHYSAAPVTSYSSTPQYPTPQPEYQAQPKYAESAYAQTPQIRNPFIQAGGAAQANSQFAPPSNYDPEYEAQVQQWQSAYVSKDDKFGSRPATTTPATTSHTPTYPSTAAPTVTKSDPAKPDPLKTVQRSGGGTTWNDPTLLEWDPAHFRIFVGNLAGEVTDESLLKAFSKYPSVAKARVIRDKRTTKSKGFGFVSFADGDDYFQAAREMQGKYIGSHPVLIKRSTTEVKPTTEVERGFRGKGRKGRGGGSGGGRGGGGGHNGYGEEGYAGVQKKAAKTKGGLKVLG